MTGRYTDARKFRLQREMHDDRIRELANSNEDSLSAELRRYLLEHASSYEADGLPAHWMMNDEWFDECRKLSDTMGFPLMLPPMIPTAPITLLGVPVTIHPDGGVPHLERGGGQP